jgi:hypothetical protein
MVRGIIVKWFQIFCTLKFSATISILFLKAKHCVWRFALRGIAFLRHFLHLFHRLRKDFLDQYQTLVLHEPDSAVSQGLKEAFLALRQAAESAD